MKRILVVEDDPNIMNLIVILLEREGYEVTQCQTAEDGIAAARRRLPHLVLMDVALPGMDGLSATRILKSADETRHVPIIALTAQAMKQDGERAAVAGCDGFIAKPLATREFLSEVARFLDGKAPLEKG
jgi:two-component system, cell cycle response regulator DivK